MQKIIASILFLLKTFAPAEHGNKKQFPYHMKKDAKDIYAALAAHDTLWHPFILLV